MEAKRQSTKKLSFDELLGRERAAKPKKTQGHQESDIQISCVKWFKLQYPRYVIFAVPNGGTRFKKEMIWMLREGILPGAADLVICGDRGKVLFVEMKTSKGRQNENQVVFERKVTELGFKYVVCRSLDNFIDTVRRWVEENRWK